MRKFVETVAIAIAILAAGFTATVVSVWRFLREQDRIDQEDELRWDPPWPEDLEVVSGVSEFARGPQEWPEPPVEDPQELNEIQRAWEAYFADDVDGPNPTTSGGRVPDPEPHFGRVYDLRGKEYTFDPETKTYRTYGDKS